VVPRSTSSARHTGSSESSCLRSAPSVPAIPAAPRGIPSPAPVSARYPDPTFRHCECSGFDYDTTTMIGQGGWCYLPARVVTVADGCCNARKEPDSRRMRFRPPSAARTCSHSPSPAYHLLNASSETRKGCITSFLNSQN
jgi:hypothetical protein